MPSFKTVSRVLETLIVTSRSDEYLRGKQDYEYERGGTCNSFVAAEPRGQRRFAQFTAQRTKADFVGPGGHLATTRG